MKLISLQAVNRPSKQRQFYKFDVATNQKRVVTANSSKLNDYLQFCFTPTVANDCDVALAFQVADQTYRLEKSFDGTSYQIQLFATFAHSQTLIETGANALSYVDAHFGVDLLAFLQNSFVDSQAVNSFNGELTAFDEIYQLHQSCAQVDAPTAPTVAVNVDQQSLQQVNQQMLQVETQLTQVRQQLAQLKSSVSQNAVVAEVLTQLAVLKDEQSKLSLNAQLVENMRAQLQTRDELVAVVPKMGDLEALSQQKSQYQAEYDQAVEQLNWQEAELQSITEQLSQKQCQTEVALDRQSKIDVINQEIQTIATLHEENKQISDKLVSLGEQKNLLLADKEIFTNKLISIENEITKCKQTLEQLQAPDKSVTDLLESVKLDTKLEEINAQIEIVKTELALKESQLAQKQTALATQVKVFRSVAELDVSVSPIKAKDTILQVLDAKYGKLEEINKSLTEKLRNLQRSVEDYHYRITQLENSRSKLQIELEHVQARKREEFKRDVYINTQRTLDDATAVYAVTTQLEDVETETLRQDLLKRTTDRDFLAQKASQLEGRIAEIKRHVAINDAEMQDLRNEKATINDHYNLIVSQNRGEAVFNYLKALESNNGTRYLLDVQQDAVKSETEIAETKRAVEALRQKLQTLQERQSRIVETRSHLSHVGESTVSTNQQIKDDLSVLTDSLSAHYSLYQSIRQQLDKTENDLLQLDGQAVQLQNQLQLNQNQIEKSQQRATLHAGTENLEQAVSNFKYQVADAGDEEQMLQDSLNLAQKEVFKKRLQVEKLQWLLQGVTTDYDSLYNYVLSQLTQRGVDIQQLNLGAINKHADQMRQTIAKYDQKNSDIATKMAHLNGLIKDVDVQVDQDLNRKIQLLTTQEADLLSQKQALDSTRQSQIQALFQGAQTQSTTGAVVNNAVRKLVQNHVNNFVANAQATLNKLEPNCTLQLVGQVVQVFKDGTLLSYSQMSAKVKTAVYLSLLLSSWQNQQGRWIVLDTLDATKDQLTQLLANTNVQYVVAYTVINKEKQS